MREIGQCTLGGFPARSDQPRQVKDYTSSSSYKKLYGCNFDQRPRIHSGRKFKYLPRHLPRQARKIQQGVRYDQHIFPNTIEPGARQTKTQDISRADPKPKHTKPTWSTSLSREKSYFIMITLLYDF
ncbi:hypothetical protein V6N12_050525 [Hibiscus sabdariffa]|uniref:Uncharacterized protein n=1 Tax=Hibiscus sabdariffa TaxID=183260 RepID=A0ABR2GCM2_9ROSI